MTHSWFTAWRWPLWLLLLLSLFVCAPTAHAQQLSFPAQQYLDSDHDGLPDEWELKVYRTDPNKADSDGDGYNDGNEIINGYDPLNKSRKVMLKDHDFDNDGLTDRLELAFGTDPTKTDTNSNGYTDGVEVMNAYSPTSTTPFRLQKSIVIHLSTQRLEQRVNDITVNSYIVSTGKPGMATPTGNYHILDKIPRAWSQGASLWMPWWMHFSGRGHGIHELPEWPNGRKEGAYHLGIPVSHGCVRLGVGPAKKLYDWTPIGTPVTVLAK